MSQRLGLTITFTCLLSLQLIGAPGDYTFRATRYSFRKSGILRTTRKKRSDALEPDSPPDVSVPHRFYQSFTLETGQTTMGIRGSNLAVRFPYINNLTSGRLVFQDSLRLSSNIQPVQSFAAGIEWGRENDFFMGVHGFLYNSSLPYSRFGDNLSVELKLGFNVSVYRNLIIRPAVSIDFNELTVGFSQQIDNRHLNINALGYSFPYQYTYHTKSGTHTVTSNSIRVGFHEETLLAKARLELYYRLSPGVMLTGSMGYTWLMSQSDCIRLQGARGQNIPLETPGLGFKSSVAPSQLFNYNGMSVSVGISFWLFPRRYH